MNSQELDRVIKASKLWIQQNRPPREKGTDEVLAAARKFLSKNQTAPAREEWIGLGGKIAYFPMGTHDEYRPGGENYLATLGSMKWEDVR